MKNNSSGPARRLAGLYDPYLDTLGGGEQFILSILKIFAEKDYQVDIFWDKNLSSEIKKRFSLSVKLEFLANIFKQRLNIGQKLTVLKKYDAFFYIPDGSYFFSSAKKNFVFCMVPKKELYPVSLINKIKTFNWKFLAISKFTQENLSRWGIKSQIIDPYVNDSFFNSVQAKEKTILSVGRFFGHLHSKKQEIIIEAFKKLKKLEHFKDFKLVLAGGLKKEDEAYFLKLKNMAENDPSIIFKTNIAFEELLTLYQRSLFYWHFTGYGLDDQKNPELVEHLGITPLEAMASGCLTFCYNAGGPKHLIKNNETGYLFDNKEELIEQMQSVIADQNKQNEIKTQAKQFVEENFSYKVFKTKVIKILKI